MVRRFLPLLLVAAMGLPVLTESIVADVRNVPVERLVTNLQRLVRERPQDLEVRINLARVHVMAYAQKRTEIPVMNHDPERWLPWFAALPDGFDLAYQQFEIKETRDLRLLAASRRHLAEAIKVYREVLVRDSENRVALIGLGWTLVQAGQRAEAITVLRRAAASAWAHELKAVPGLFVGEPGAALPGFGLPGMTEEAARYLVPLLDPTRDAEEIARLSGRLKKLGSAIRWITPIAIPLRGGLTPFDLVDAEACVAFDLDGLGPKRWQWITPDAAWLVYDHQGTGRITSGLQLFGHVTFWAFWQNGYHALRALDDDGDGEVRGNELRGFGLWHDRNSNGLSERGEVRPLAAWGIVSLLTDYDFDPSHPDEIPWSTAGVRFADGSARPSFDLVLHAR